jgi:hypothetical protein
MRCSTVEDKVATERKLEDTFAVLFFLQSDFVLDACRFGFVFSGPLGNRTNGKASPVIGEKVEERRSKIRVYSSLGLFSHNATRVSNSR